MAIESVNLARESSSEAGLGTEKVTKSYVVVTDGNSTADQVRTAVGIPRPGSILLTSGILIAGRASAKQRDGSVKVWDVEVDFETPESSADPEQEAADPLARPPVISFNFTDSTIPFNFEVDDDGNLDTTKPVVNTAGQGFDPQPEREQSDAVVQIVRNEASFTIADAYFWHNAVNSVPFAGIEAGKVKLKVTGASREVETITNTDASTTTIFFWKVTRELHLRQDGWDVQIISRGLREVVVDSSGEATTQPITIQGKVTTEPQNLDSAGFLQGPGETPHVMTFQAHKRRNFNALGLA